MGWVRYICLLNLLTVCKFCACAHVNKNIPNQTINCLTVLQEIGNTCINRLTVLQEIYNTCINWLTLICIYTVWLRLPNNTCKIIVLSAIRYSKVIDAHKHFTPVITILYASCCNLFCQSSFCIVLRALPVNEDNTVT